MVAYTGGDHACGIKTDDTLWCWGSDVRGQIGNGPITGNQQSPVQIGTDLWKDITGGGQFNGEGWTCGIKMDDSLWCWGWHIGASQDVLGLGGLGDQDTPQHVAPGTTWKSITAGWHTTCGIRTDDTLWCWGSNDNGIAGTGGASSVPVQVGTATWRDVVMSTRSACGIQTNGTRHCWGQSIGPTPQAVADGGNWLDIEIRSELFAGFYCGIRTGNQLWCFSGNGSPTQVSGGGEWIDVAMTGGQQCAVRVGGQVYCWGSPGNALGFVVNSTEVTPTIGDCGGPATQAGGMRYHAPTNSMVYCDGVGFRAIGKGDPCNGSQAVGTTCADGSIYAGLSPDGNVPMFTTPADAPTGHSWNNGGAAWVNTAVPNCPTGSPGAAAGCFEGRNNTAILVGLGLGPAPAPYRAARYCNDLVAHGRSDWYLPAQDELNVLYQNRMTIGGFNLTGSFMLGWYWSSSESASGDARAQNFDSGDQFNYFYEGDALSVRCVRRVP
jgi:hypothetical protein